MTLTADQLCVFLVFGMRIMNTRYFEWEEVEE